MTARPHPFALVFGQLPADRLPEIQTALEQAEVDPTDRDAFLLQRSAAQLVHDLEPEGGLGEGVAQLAALVHHAFLFWLDGERTHTLDLATIRTVLASSPDASAPATPVSACYVQLPRQLVWGRLDEGEAFEPLDGCFLSPSGGTLRALGIFGLHVDRTGFSVAEGVAAPDDHEATFAPAMEGGSNAGLFSIHHPEDLVVLATRALSAAPRPSGAPE